MQLLIPHASTQTARIGHFSAGLQVPTVDLHARSKYQWLAVVLAKHDSKFYI
jgi:hypothetical protein